MHRLKVSGFPFPSSNMGNGLQAIAALRSVSLCVGSIHFVSISGCLPQYLQLTNWAAFSFALFKLPISCTGAVHCGGECGQGAAQPRQAVLLTVPATLGVRSEQFNNIERKKLITTIITIIN